jgi:hypothetical protein
MLRDLLAVIPTLSKHGIDGEVKQKVRTLRNGRKSKSYTLELSRTVSHVNHELIEQKLTEKGEVISRSKKACELKVSAPVSKEENKLQIMKKLKGDICAQIKALREQNKPPIEDYTFHQGVVVKKLAEVYLEPGSFIKVLHKKIRQDMTKTKKPTSTDNYIGIEIELASKKDRNFICDKLFEAGLGKYVGIKDDGSIGRGTKLTDTHPHTHELALLVRQSEFEDVVTRTCKVLNEQCEVAVDKTCGLHIHLDMRNRKVENAFHNLVSCQQIFYAMLPAARRSSQYSYPVKGTKWRVLDARYHGINSQAYSKYKTLELRMHCGTTQANKINNWIKLALAVAEAPLITKAPTSVASLRTAVTSIGDGLAAYVEARIAKFRSQHKSTTPQHEEPGTMPEIEDIIGTPAVDNSVSEQSEVA